MAQREAAQARQQADLDRRAAELAQAELAQRAEAAAARREPARPTVPRVETEPEPEPPRRSEKKRDRDDVDEYGDEQRDAKRVKRLPLFFAAAKGFGEAFLLIQWMSR